MIKVESLLKKYGELVAVDIPELTIAKNESFGLVGNNGAGKTTFFRLLLDLVRPNKGKVYSNDEKVARNESWKDYTGSYLDEGFLIDFLTAEEYFEFIGNTKGMNKADIDAFLQQFEELFNDEILGKKKFIRDLSKGNQKKIGIVAALMGNPELLILDEPFANLDPTTQIRLKKLLKDLKENHNVTMLISSHDLNHVTEVCERIAILEKSKIVKDLQTNEDTLKELEDYFSV